MRFLTIYIWENIGTALFVFFQLRTVLFQCFSLLFRHNRVFRLQPFQFFKQNFRKEEPGVPLFIGRDDIPGNFLGGSSLKGFLIGPLVILPKGTLFYVGRVKLPVFLGVVNPL